MKPGWAKANRRSGRRPRNELKARTPCASGEAVMACDVPPGDVQADTFAPGGDDPSDSFFRILDATDKKTQWTVPFRRLLDEGVPSPRQLWASGRLCPWRKSPCSYATMSLRNATIAGIP